MRAKSSHWRALLLVAALLCVAGPALAATPASALLRQGVQAYKQYYATLHDLDWRQVIAPENLTPAGIQTGLDTVRKATRALHVYAAAEQRLVRSIGNPSSGSGDTATVARAMTRYVQHDLTHERRKIAAVKQVLTTLAAHPDAWHTDGQHLTFKNPGSKPARTVYQALQTVHRTVAASRADRAQLRQAVQGHASLLRSLLF